jgi:phage I-like protein
VAQPPLRGKAELPPRLLIVPWGTSYDLSGAPVICNEVTLSVLSENQRRFGFEEVTLDFNHGTIPANTKTETEHGTPKKVAGYGVLSCVAGEGIYYTPTVWTPEGEEHYTGRHYRDLSPTPARNAQGEVIFIQSVALCRQGQITGLTAYHAPTPLSANETTTTETTPTKTMDLKALLLKLLKLTEDATDEQIIAAADAMMAPPAPEKKEDPAPAADPMSAITSRLDQIERNVIVDQATAAGKVIPLSADQIAATPVETLRSMVANLQKTVPLATDTNVVPMHAKAPGATALSAEEKLICQQLNISEEQFLKAR